MNQITNNHLVERARRLFGDSACNLQVAALPWRTKEDRVEVMLITSRDTGRWVLPKGDIEKDEKRWRGAEREAVEEAGIRGAVSRREAGRYFYAKVQWIGRALPCEVIVYPLEVSTVADNWKERDSRTRIWVSPGEAATMVDEEDLGEILRTFAENATSFRADHAK